MSFDKTFPCDFNLLLHLFKLGSTVLLRHQWVKQEMALSHHRRLLLFRFQNKKCCPILFSMKWCVVEFRKNNNNKRGPVVTHFVKMLNTKQKGKPHCFAKLLCLKYVLKLPRSKIFVDQKDTHILSHEEVFLSSNNTLIYLTYTHIMCSNKLCGWLQTWWVIRLTVSKHLAQTG